MDAFDVIQESLQKCSRFSLKCQPMSISPKIAVYQQDDPSHVGKKRYLKRKEDNHQR